ncbi:hypothetical protein Zm00014a_012717 [Zea mays]|uniref:Uncharacterized protein n=1 Tax=Zea mays TaxID=4577 RepID=A0A3L6DSX4_MAIZE|nr:hypothetical protein Zm00014a_012717 [Zea mays]
MALLSILDRGFLATALHLSRPFRITAPALSLASSSPKIPSLRARKHKQGALPSMARPAEAGGPSNDGAPRPALAGGPSIHESTEEPWSRARGGPPRPGGRARAAPGCTGVGARPRPPLRRIRGRGRALAWRTAEEPVVEPRPRRTAEAGRPGTHRAGMHGCWGQTAPAPAPDLRPRPRPCLEDRRGASRGAAPEEDRRDSVCCKICLCMESGCQSWSQGVKHGSAIIRHNQPEVWAFCLGNGYAGLKDALGSNDSRLQRIC